MCDNCSDTNCNGCTTIDIPIGDQGDTGVIGIQGEQGVQGEQGPQGIQGTLGPLGFSGAQGAPGTIWSTISTPSANAIVNANTPFTSISQLANFTNPFSAMRIHYLGTDYLPPIKNIYVNSVNFPGGNHTQLRVKDITNGVYITNLSPISQSANEGNVIMMPVLPNTLSSDNAILEIEAIQGQDYSKMYAILLEFE